jgi:hypothetical protein
MPIYHKTDTNFADFDLGVYDLDMRGLTPGSTVSVLAKFQTSNV